MWWDGTGPASIRVTSVNFFLILRTPKLSLMVWFFRNSIFPVFFPKVYRVRSFTATRSMNLTDSEWVGSLGDFPTLL